MDTSSNNQDEAIDAELTKASEPTIQNQNSNVLLSLDSLIKNTVLAIDKISEELKKHKEMFADGFTNNPTFKELDEKTKQANKEKLAVRQQIVKIPAIATIGEKIRSFSAELKERKASLSEYLLEYQRMTGVNEIEIPGGDVREIVKEAKLVKKANLNRK